MPSSMRGAASSHWDCVIGSARKNHAAGSSPECFVRALAMAWASGSRAGTSARTSWVPEAPACEAIDSAIRMPAP